MHPDSPIPTIRIDLSQPPRERYNELCSVFGEQMRHVSPLLDEILELALPRPWGPLRMMVKGFLRTAGRRMYNREETEELKGISRRTGIKMHILVAFNVLLDCLMGCTSGAALINVKPRPGKKRSSRDGEEPSSSTSHGIWSEEEGAPPKKERYNLRNRSKASQRGMTETGQDGLMHFRTLDWGMDSLRSLLVTLEFVDSSAKDPSKVIARSVTYAGFVGVLTGARERLSLSLNFRPNHACSTFKLRLHQLGVLMGIRPSSGSLLRSVVVPESLRQSNIPDSPIGTIFNSRHPQRLETMAKLLSRIPCAPCYITICDPDNVAIIEKDLHDGVVTTNSGWASITNHDKNTPAQSTTEKAKLFLDEGWLQESEERCQAMDKKWDVYWNGRVEGRDKIVATEAAGSAEHMGMSLELLEEWLLEYPVTNECTHFACIMDPRTGELVSLRRGLLEWDGESGSDSE